MSNERKRKHNQTTLLSHSISNPASVNTMIANLLHRYNLPSKRSTNMDLTKGKNTVRVYVWTCSHVNEWSHLQQLHLTCQPCERCTVHILLPGSLPTIVLLVSHWIASDCISYVHGWSSVICIILNLLSQKIQNKYSIDIGKLSASWFSFNEQGTKFRTWFFHSPFIL